MLHVMDPGIQAVSARIAALHQRFDPASAAVSATSSGSSAATSTSSTDFASMLASALGTTSIDGVGAGALGSSSTGSLVSGLLGQGAAGGLAGTTGGNGGAMSTAAIVELLVAVARGAAGAPSTGGGAGTVGGTTSAGGLTPAARLAPGQYPKLTPPAELVGYGNGRIPAERLEPIGVGSHRLYAPAAQAYRTMTADAAAQGVQIGITDSYRTYDSQVDLAGRKGLYSQGGLAATPGTSNHGWGLAVDLDLDPTAQQWMRDNGWRYGFVEDTPREPWHWAYRPQSA